MTFNVGDKVKLKNDFELSPGRAIPKGSEGVVMEIKDNMSRYPLRVKFTTYEFTGGNSEYFNSNGALFLASEMEKA